MVSTTIKERPILFSAPMVRAILKGRKTQTRRIVKWPSKAIDADDGCTLHESCNGGLWPYADYDGNEIPLRCPYGQPGDRLWVRETFAKSRHNWLYTASSIADDGPQANTDDWDWDDSIPNRWKPSIHMPRIASRITLEVTGVRVERLKQIDPTDVQLEGFEIDNRTVKEGGVALLEQFARLWETLNGKGSWEVNPWVWVVSFKRVEE